jgi:hypothetical protein
MTNEAHNVKVHNAGFGQWDWNFYTDVSIDRAYNEVDISDGIDTAEVMALLRSTTDDDQITHREARQLYGVFTHHWADLNEEARALATKIGDKLYEAYPSTYVPPDILFPGEGAPPLIENRDENYRSANDSTNLQGDEMRQFVADMERAAEPAWVRAVRDAMNALGRI